jgi:hypothetical protein
VRTLSAAAVTPARARGWLRADRLLASEAAVRSHVVAVGSALGAPSLPVAAALAFKEYSYSVLEPVVTGWATERRVPDHTASRVYVRPSATGADVLPARRIAVLHGDPLAGRAGVSVVDDLLAEIRRTLLDGHLALAVEAYRRIRGGGARPLWGSLVQSLCYPATVAASADPHAGVRALLSVLDPSLAALVEVADVGNHPVILRRTCCFAYALPSGELCRSCCLHDEASQDEAFRVAGMTLRRTTPRPAVRRENARRESHPPPGAPRETDQPPSRPPMSPPAPPLDCAPDPAPATPP